LVGLGPGRPPQTAGTKQGPKAGLEPSGLRGKVEDGVAGSDLARQQVALTQRIPAQPDRLWINRASCGAELGSDLLRPRQPGAKLLPQLRPPLTEQGQAARKLISPQMLGQAQSGGGFRLLRIGMSPPDGLLDLGGRGPALA
jgi:hypothetical protein